MQVNYIHQFQQRQGRERDEGQSLAIYVTVFMGKKTSMANICNCIYGKKTSKYGKMLVSVKSVC